MGKYLEAFVSVTLAIHIHLLVLILMSPCLSSVFSVHQNRDISSSPYIFESKELPQDEAGAFSARRMASIGNGHVATTLFTDTVYMNGLYNGFKGESHRARIPSRNNIRIGSITDNEILASSYALNVRDGVFTESISTSKYIVRIHTFAHRFFHKVIVTQFEVTAKGASAYNRSLTLNLETKMGKESEDIEFEPEVEMRPEKFNHVNTKFVPPLFTCGHTISVEDPTYQSSYSHVCIVSTKIPKSVTVKTHKKKTRFTFFAAYDVTLDCAAKDYFAVAQMISDGGHQTLYKFHVNSWRSLWNQGRITISGNLELAKAANGCLYYILSSLPIGTPTHSGVSEPFYGLSPTGLASGGYNQDYQGHTFWDTEIWMFPVILNFYPEAARELLNYRLRNLMAAKAYAKETGWNGSRFPWESGFTGADVTPARCQHPHDLQIHVTGDISFAIKQYLASTSDFDWLKLSNLTNGNQTACDLVRDVADFWVSRATFNESTGQHDINGVMPPDEDNYSINNSIYTNVIASQSILFAKSVESLCAGKTGPIPNSWILLAKSLTFPFDAKLNYHPEYSGYSIGTTIKQADVVLLGYPLLHPMDPSTRLNDLKIYENVTRITGPAMTWAMHAIGHLELGNIEEGERLFLKSYQPYLLQPFKIWSESPAPKYGAMNFLTGMGAFLQGIINGYAGLRLYSDKLVFLNPKLPGNTSRLSLVGLKYLGNSLEFTMDKNFIRIQKSQVGRIAVPLTVEANTETYLLTDGDEIVLPRTTGPVTIRKKE